MLLHGLVHILVQIHDMPRQGRVQILITVVQHDKEEVETRHNGRREVNIGFQGLAAVITAINGVGGGQHCSTGVQGRLTLKQFLGTCMPALEMVMVCCSMAS